MKFGLSLPQCGALAQAENLKTAAGFAENEGFSSLWTFDRLLYPTDPRTPYPASPDGKLPDKAKRVLDPIEALTYVAALTEKVRLGTSVLNLPFYNPVVLGRQLAALDFLSQGRLVAGFGLGWSEDEYIAAGTDGKERGKKADEFLQVLRALWGDDPVEYSGSYFQLPRSLVGLKPAQKGGPPVLLGAFAPAALDRVARLADGWNPAGLPIPALEAMWGQIKTGAKAHGRDPSQLQLVVRANVTVLPQPLPERKFPFLGSLDQIREDVAAHRDFGVEELILDVQFSPQVQTMEDFKRLASDLRG